MSLFDLDRNQMTQYLAGEPKFRHAQLWDGIYRNLAFAHEQTNLPKALRAKLSEIPEMQPGLYERQTLFGDGKNTLKTLYELSDGREIESVLMRYRDRVTLCVSSQAGCAMGCVFCATGHAGFFRHLTKGEILEQVFYGARRARDLFGQRLSNIVFMGMGEPMANFENVLGAAQLMSFEFGISARHITISTVGIIPGIRKLAEQPMPVSLAVSLHAANDIKRSRLVPINSRYPIGDLMAALEFFKQHSTRRISFEWAMMADINDGPEDASELAELALTIGAHVNLIPLNPTPLWPYPGSDSQTVHAFRERLIGLGVNATIRKNRGNQIAAACGQLLTQQKERRSNVKLLARVDPPSPDRSE